MNFNIPVELVLCFWGDKVEVFPDVGDYTLAEYSLLDLIKGQMELITVPCSDDPSVGKVLSFSEKDVIMNTKKCLTECLEYLDKFEMKDED